MAEFNLTPVFRMEKFIDAIINGTTPPEPQFREEFYFAKVAGMDVELPTPINRREFYLAKYAGMDVDPPAPVTRDEMYLALACGLGVEPPEPVFRDEYWLYELSGGGKWSWKTVSGSMIHITDAVYSPMQKCEVTLEPIQDLHGQDAPYPSGGGKNKFKTTLQSTTIRGTTFTVNEDGSITVTGAPSSTITTEAIFGIVKLPAGTYKVNGFSKGSVTSSRMVVDTSIDGTSYSGSQSIYGGNEVQLTLAEERYVRIYPVIGASIGTDTFNFYPMIRDESISDDTFAPYENLCPITGWTGCEVTRTGGNLLGGTALKDNVVENVSSAVVDTTNKTVSFAYTFAPTTGTPIVNGVPFKENTQYTFMLTLLNATIARTNMLVVYTDGTTANLDMTKTNEKELVVFTSSANKTVSCIGLRRSGGTTVIYYDESGIFEGVLTADDFEPYNGTTLSVTFPDGLINQWDEEWEVGGISSANGQNVQQDNIRSKNYIPVIAGDEYYVLISRDVNNKAYLFYYDSSKAYVGSSGAYVRGGVTIPSGAAFMRFQCNQNYGYRSYNNDISINYPSTITDYHPYHDDVVYGCTVDFVSGELVVDRAIIDLSTLNWLYASSYQFFRSSITGMKRQGIICSSYKSSEAPRIEGIADKEIWNNGYAFDPINVVIKDTAYTDASIFKASLSGVTAVYYLAEPITYQLTPQQIRTLKGENNVWGSGDLEITYKAQE